MSDDLFRVHQAMGEGAIADMDTVDERTILMVKDIAPRLLRLAVHLRRKGAGDEQVIAMLTAQAVNAGLQSRELT